MKKCFIYLGLVACGFLNVYSSNLPQKKVSDKQSYTVIPFEKGHKNIKQVKLSDIAERVTFIPMETTDIALIAKPKIMNIVYVNEKIVIPCSEGVLVYDKNGKFQNKISRKGQGPGEYVQLRSVSVNEKTGTIYLQDNHKILSFRTDGEFIKERKIPSGSSLETLVMQGEITLSAILNNTGKRPYRLLLTNDKGDTLKAFPQYDHFDIPNGMNWYYWNNREDYIYSHNKDVVYRDYYSDTIYTVTPNALLPRFLLDMGKYHLPKNLRLEAACVSSDRDEKLLLAEKYLRPTVFENDRYIIMSYTSWNLYNHELPIELMVYDRQTKECIKVKNNAFMNDMKGSLPFHPDIRIAENVLAEWWEASELMELAEKGVKLPDNLKNLKEDDNGVLVLVHLKK